MMKTVPRLTQVSLSSVGIGLVLASVIAWPSSPVNPGKSGSPYRISGPHSHENLSIFLIHGEDQLKGKAFLTLQEAMEQKKVVVHETSHVNQLAIENVSGEEVYIQSGDIVKGGKQDRVISFDFVVPAKSGRMPIASFCVEQGRWQPRGREAAHYFSSSNEQLSTKDLKLAAKHQSAQRAVCDKVSVAQARLSANAGILSSGGGGAPVSVQAAESASSLQLTLENPHVKAGSEAYLQKLSPVVQGKKDVIGYAFAINGKVNSADVYANAALFRKLWPRLLKAATVEAIAEYQQGKVFPSIAAGAVRSCLADVATGSATQKEVTKRIKMVTQETDKNLLFETRDHDNKDAWIHRNYITK
jgi:hypothetical protein